jgi:hypothetical protein
MGGSEEPKRSGSLGRVQKKRGMLTTEGIADNLVPLVDPLNPRKRWTLDCRAKGIDAILSQLYAIWVLMNVIIYLEDLRPGASSYYGCRCADVEGVMPIPSGSHNIHYTRFSGSCLHGNLDGMSS